MIRLSGLLLETLLFSGAIGVIAGVVGFFLAGVAEGSGKKMKGLLLTSLFLLLIPSSVYALAYQNIARQIPGILILQGWGPSLFVNVLYFIPLSFGLQLFLLRAMPVETFELQKLDVKNTSAFWSNHYQYSRSIRLLVWVLIFILSINDFAIGSIYGYNTYPIEIMTGFASSASLAAAIGISLPLLLLSVGILWLLSRTIGKVSEDIRLPIIGTKVRWEHKISLPLWQKLMAMVIVIAVFYLPVMGIVMIAVQNSSKGPAGIPMGDMGYTLMLGLIIGGIICLLSFSMSYYTYYRGRSGWSAPWLMLIPLMPGTLMGVGVNSLFQSVIPGVSKDLMLPFYYLIRFLPVGLLFSGIYFRQFDIELLEAYRMEKKGMFSAYRDLFLSAGLMPMLLLLLFVFALISQELGGTLMTLMPGKSTLTVTIYSYLHYGSTGMVNRLSLLYIGVVASVGCIVFLLMKVPGKRSWNKLWMLLTVGMLLLSSCGQQRQEDGIFFNFGHGIDVLSMVVHKGVLYAGAGEGIYRITGEMTKEGAAVYSMQQIDMPSELFLVKDLVSCEGYLLAGTDTGLAVIDIEPDHDILQTDSVVWIDMEDGLPDQRVNGLYLDGNRLWIGTFGGVAAVSIDKTTPQHWHADRVYNAAEGLLVDTVNVIAGIDDAMVFASYNDRYGGISILRDGDFTYLKEELADINTTAMLQLENHRLMVGGGILETGGLSLIGFEDEQGMVLEQQDGTEQGAGAKVRSLLLQEDLLFVGSEYDGFAVWRLDDGKISSLEVERERISFYSDKNGLIHNEVKCIHMDGDRILFGTKGGISAADISEFYIEE